MISRRKFLRGAVMGLAIVSLLGVSAGYTSWRRSHLERQARDFFDRHDYTDAALTCRRLLQIDAQNLVAFRLMGESARSAGSADAINWFQRLAALAPTNDNQLDLAATALSFGKNVLAGYALEKIPAADRDSARFHELAGAIAIAQNQSARALQHFSAAERLQPSNPQVKFDRAAIELALGSQRAEKARADLSQLTLDPQLHLNALRALLNEAVARGDEVAQENWTARLRTDAKATFADNLLCLESATARHREMEPLSAIEKVAGKSPPLAAVLIGWMNRHHHAADAITWVKTLPNEIAITQPIPLALAESYSCTRQWTVLRDFVEAANWKNMEALRLTIAHHAARQLDSENSLAANSHWREAIEAAHNNNAQLFAMAEMCRGWGYNAQADEAYWIVAGGNADVEAALNALQRHYQAQRDARGLFRVAQRAAQLNPDDAIASNNCASLGLLLKGDAASRRLAEKLHDDHPRVAAFASTYAFALSLEGRSTDALRLLSRFKPQLIRSPALAAYYVVISVANGNIDAARPLRELAERARLLPEEEQLLHDAVAKL